jgi:hypothetical protein
MKPVYSDEQTVQSFSVDDLKKTLNESLRILVN